MAITLSFFVLLAFFLVYHLYANRNKENKNSDTISPEISGYQTEPNSIIIPKIDINSKIYDDPTPGAVTDSFLNKGPSYYNENTNKPDQGNTVIFGHSASTQEHDAPFARIGNQELSLNDEIILTDKDNHIYKYKISEIRTIDSNDFSVIQPSEKPTVTIITCIAPDYPKDKRLLIRGSLSDN
ncbi:MAG: sortase [Candidatus Berkelbacteria bacterium]|nr:sortase [Candidatus Berkelbacteria bacterium]